MLSFRPPVSPELGCHLGLPLRAGWVDGTASRDTEIVMMAVTDLWPYQQPQGAVRSMSSF